MKMKSTDILLNKLAVEEIRASGALDITLSYIQSLRLKLLQDINQFGGNENLLLIVNNLAINL